MALYFSAMPENLPPDISVRLGPMGRVRWEPTWKISPTFFANLNDLDLWFIWAGRGHLSMNGNDVELKPGTCLLLKPGGKYEGGHDPADRLGVNYVHFTFASPLSPEQISELPEVFSITDQEFVNATMRRIVSLGRLQEGWPLAEGLMTELVRQLLWEHYLPPSEEAPVNITPDQREMIHKLLRKIHEDPGQPVTIPDMAAQVGYSQDHFARVFRAVTLKTPRDYVIDARIERARQMLVQTDLKVEQIAEALNFNNIYFFSRQFRQRTGQTPTQFRRTGKMTWVSPSKK
jgi:AraC-like DNA-binding protein